MIANRDPENDFSSCWIVTEGMAGTENQCLGVADALGLAPRILRIKLREPWRTLSPWFRFENAGSFSPEGDVPAPPWPDLLIASGRKAIAAARYIKKASGGASFVVFLQSPKAGLADFDLIAAPAHDGLKGPNVITTLAAPNRVTAQRLAAAREAFSSALEDLPRPRLAVLIGGNSRAHAMTPEVLERLAARLRLALKENGGALMVTASRRTPDALLAAFREKIAGLPQHVWDGEEPNPYHAYLAFADTIIVTADSVSMISEAATTGKPVFVQEMPGGSARFARFHKALEDRGAIRPFTGSLDHAPYQPVNDAQFIAAAIREHLAKRKAVV